MATFFRNTYLGDTSVAANFSAFWGMVDNQLQNLGGWTYVPTAGDAVFASASLPSTNVFNLYRIYSTVVGSTTWYMRLGPGRNGTAFWEYTFQLGSTVDASGTLGGITTTPFTGSNASGMAATFSLWMSQDVGRLTFYYGNLSNRGFQVSLSVHGQVDSTGSFLNGIEYYYASNLNGQNQFLPVSGNVQPVTALWNGNDLSGNATNDIGTTVVFSFAQSWNQDAPNWPTPAVCIAGTTDVLQAGVIFPLTVYGRIRNYLSSNMQGQMGNTNNFALLLFD